MNEKGQNVHAFPPLREEILGGLDSLEQRPGSVVCGEAADRLGAVRKTAERIAAR